MSDKLRPVRPGEGVEVEQHPLVPTKRLLEAGEFVLGEPEYDAVHEVLEFARGLQENDRKAHVPLMRAALDMPETKKFRNAYTSLIIEQWWPAYRELVAGDSRGIYDRLGFDGTGGTFLGAKTDEDLADMSARDIAFSLAVSNEAVTSHLICETFRDGRVPVISGDPSTDSYYLGLFHEQTELDAYAGTNFRKFPSSPGYPSVFMTSGTYVIKTLLFGLPNVIDDVTRRDGIILSPEQHRNSVIKTLLGTVTPYYAPTTSIVIPVTKAIMELDTPEALSPQNWTHDGNLDNLQVFPRPEILQGTNESLRGLDHPIQTKCPAFHSKVPAAEAEVPGVLPLPRSFVWDVIIPQLDHWYYPRRHQEAQAG